MLWTLRNRSVMYFFILFFIIIAMNKGFERVFRFHERGGGGGGGGGGGIVKRESVIH